MRRFLESECFLRTAVCFISIATSALSLSNCGGGSSSQDMSPPDPPTELTATAVSDSQINLSLTAPLGAVTEYWIYRSGSFLKSVPVTETSTSDTGLSPATNYCYTVIAFNSSGDSPPSNEACAITRAAPVSPPDPPFNLTAAVVSSNQINLSWTAYTDTVTGFRLYRSGSFLKSVPVTEFSTSDTGLSPSTNYCYRVIAFNSAGDSPPSNEACAITQAPPGPPLDPPNLTATAYASDRIYLSWTAPPLTMGFYSIYRSGSFLQVVPATQTSFYDTGLSPSTNYCYYVIAYTPEAHSPPSNEACAITQAPPVSPPDPPTNLIASTHMPSYSQIDLSWTAPLGQVTVYKIYMDGNYIYSVPATSTSTSITGLGPDSYHCFRVIAYNSAGDSPPSNEACARTFFG